MQLTIWNRCAAIGRLAAGLALVAPLAVLSAAPAGAEEAASSSKGLEIDFLLSYYDQDGDNSPVTGGIGTEDLQVISPVVLVKWQINDDWTLGINSGLDQITSASTDRMDDAISSASEVDNRGYSTIDLARKMGEQTWRVSVGFSKEYDYASQSFGLGWSRDFNQRTSTLSLGLRYFDDTIDLYDIDGINQGEDERTTLELSAAWSQVLGPRTVFSVEANYTDQEGFLSTPFHEVILAPGPNGGARGAERAPDNRTRTALGLRLNHGFTDRIIGRFGYRFYDDDFGIQAHTVEVEPHFRLPTEREIWLYPILRYHTQTGADFFGLPGTFTGDEPYFTADRDLSEFDSEKFGFGATFHPRARSGWLRHLKRFQFRLTSYSRDDGLDAMTGTFGFGWSF